MSISGHKNLKEVTIYTEAANRKKLALLAMAKLAGIALNAAARQAARGLRGLGRRCTGDRLVPQLKLMPLRIERWTLVGIIASSVP